MSSWKFSVLAFSLLSLRCTCVAQIYVSSFGSNSVLEYDAVTGAFIGTFVPPGSGGLTAPEGIVFGPDGNLYVTVGGTGTVLRYNGQTGAFMGAFVPAGSGGGVAFAYMVFGPNGNLFVNDFGRNIKEYDGATGAFITVFAPSIAPSLGLVFGPDGNLYVPNGNGTDVDELDGTTGAFIKAFPLGPGPAGEGPAVVAFGPDGNLYVGTVGPCCPEVSGEILKYNPTTGALIGVFVAPGSGGLGAVNDIEFRPDGYLYVVSENTAGTDSPPYPARQILRYDATTGAFVGVFIPAGSGGPNRPTTLTFAPAPAIIQANPNAGQQGQSNESVTITGQLTHWVQGTTTASFGDGVTVVSLTVNSATSASAVLSIDPAAAVGPRDVTLTTGTEVSTALSAFTVNTGSPMILSVDPNTGIIGQQNLTVTITALFTHFAQGHTTVDFGAGITVVSVTVNSPTSLTVVIDIAPDASYGPRTVTVSTHSDPEIVTLDGGFFVRAAGNAPVAGAPFQVGYAANLDQGESWINIVNTGANGAALLGPGIGGAVGNLCVNVYVTTPDEELISCCSCLVTPDQIVNLGVNRDILPNNTHSGQVITSVTVTLLGTLAGATGNGTSCAESAAAATSANVVGGFVAFGTTLHAAAGGAPYAVTEVPFIPATLSTGELASLGNRCTAIIGNLSGYGICAACRPGALGAAKQQ